MGTNPATLYASIIHAGFPENGGSVAQTQSGDQYIVRIKKTDLKNTAPSVHTSVWAKSYGTLEIKQVYDEGKCFAMRVTGKVANRVDV